MPVIPGGVSVSGDVDGGDAEKADDQQDERAGDFEGGMVAQRARGRREPGVPTPEEIRRHVLTHLPYRRWCRFCVMARCRNEAHHRLPSFSRTQPLFCADDCFVRDSRDQSCLTLLVGRLCPDRSICVMPCDVKGSWQPTKNVIQSPKSFFV